LKRSALASLSWSRHLKKMAPGTLDPGPEVSSRISSPYLGHDTRGSPVRAPNLMGPTLCADDELPSDIADCVEALRTKECGRGRPDRR